MKLYKKIDNYLLHHFPNIWATRMHVFLPIGLISAGIIYLVNTYLIGYQLKQDLPQDGGITTLVIPTIIFLVIWFVFQSRYNVEKSGGKLSVPKEYFNYFLYFLVFSTALLLVTSVDYSNDAKVANVINDREFIQDIKDLNIGHVVMNKPGDLTKINENLYRFPNKMMVSKFYMEDSLAFGFENSFSVNNKVWYYEISRDKELFAYRNHDDSVRYNNAIENYPKITIYDTAKFFKPAIVEKNKFNALKSDINEDYLPGGENHNRKKYLSKEEFYKKFETKEIITYGGNFKDYETREVFIHDYYYSKYFTYVSKNKLIDVLEKYTLAYNKYVPDEIHFNYEDAIDYNVKDIKVEKLFLKKSGNYYYKDKEKYYRSVYYNDDDSFYYQYYAENKIEDMTWVLENNHNAFYVNYIGADFYKIFLFFLCYLALLVWIFKQIHWKNYVFGLISLALTPLFIGVSGFLIYKTTDGGSSQENVMIGYVMILYVLVFVKVLLGYFSNKKNKTSIVAAMYLQFFLPILPMILIGIYKSIVQNEYYYDYEFFDTLENYGYWAGLILGLLSIFVFKSIYRKMSLLPNNK